MRSIRRRSGGLEGGRGGGGGARGGARGSAAAAEEEDSEEEATEEEKAEKEKEAALAAARKLVDEAEGIETVTLDPAAHAAAAAFVDAGTRRAGDRLPAVGSHRLRDRPGLQV